MQHDFEKNNYVLVEKFIDDDMIKIISMYLENKIRREEWIKNEKDIEEVITKFCYYADPLIEVILLNQTEKISKICKKELYPTYSYSRIYQKNEELKPHVDRPSCEISVTVNVASKGEESSIWLYNGKSTPKFYYLKPGDAIIYKGCEVLHWREKLSTEQLNVQFMLHYVDKNGPYSEYKYDKRQNLGYNFKKEN